MYAQLMQVVKDENKDQGKQFFNCQNFFNLYIWLYRFLFSNDENLLIWLKKSYLDLRPIVVSGNLRWGPRTCRFEYMHSSHLRFGDSKEMVKWGLD